MRSDIEFPSGGLTCRGWYYRPEGEGRHPAVLMSPGFSAVKEQKLANFAERFAAEGFAVVVFDYRHLGASDGSPRGRIIPQLQHDDLRAALDFMLKTPEIDPARIGLWGSAYSGGHALWVGALDPRVKAIVAQVPAIGIARSLLMMYGRPEFDSLLVSLAAEHAARNAGVDDRTMPVVSQDGRAFLPTSDSFVWFTAAAAALNWKNQVTMESVARAIEYMPAAFIELIAPKPLLIQAAERDALIPIGDVRTAFARAREPKKLEVYDCGHYDLYDGPLHQTAQQAQVDWWRQTL